MTATSFDLSQIKTDALSSAAAFRALIGSPATSHTHGVGDITGLGTLATQSPTGTPSASTFLRGDFSWQTIDLSGYVPTSRTLNTLDLSANQTFAVGTSGTDFAISSSGTTHTFNIPDASASNRGLVTTGTQTIAGGKTFSSSVVGTTGYGASSAFRCGTGGVAYGSVGTQDAYIQAYSTGNYIYLGTSTGGTPISFGLVADREFMVLGSGVVLRKESVGILALRDSTNSQRFNLYGTYTDASNYRRLFLSSTTAGAFTLGVEGAGTGASGNTLELQVAGVTGLTIQSGQAMFPAGSKTAPGLRIAGSSTVGFFSSGTQLYFSDGGGGGADSLGFVGGLRLPRVNYLNFTSTTSATDVPDTRYGRDSSSSKALIGAANGLSVKTYDFTADAPVSASLATLSTGTITVSTPALNVSQTWNNAATTFTGILANVTDTASNAASLLMDLQVGGSSKFSVRKDGGIIPSSGTVSAPAIRNPNFANQNGIYFLDANTIATAWGGGQFFTFSHNNPGAYFQLNYNADIRWGDLTIARDAADTLALRRTTNPNNLRIYNTYTDASNYERGKIAWESNVLRIGTEKAGTGSARALELQTDGTTRLTIGITGYETQFFQTILCSAARSTNVNGNNSTYGYNGVGISDFLSYTIGYRNGYPTDNATGTLSFVGNSAYSSATTNIVGGNVLVTAGNGAASSAGAANGGHVYLDGGQGYGTGVHGSIIIGATRARLLAFGGITSSFPAIKRNSAALNFRLADDSGDCDITAKAATFSGNVTITQGTSDTSVLTSTGYSLTGSNAQSLIDVAGTWNTTGTPTLLKANVTDTASNAASLLLDLQVGGSSKFKVDKSGVATIGTIIVGRQTSLYGGASVDEIRATTNNVLSVRFGSTNFAANRITGDAAGYQIAFATRYTSDTSYVAMISNGLSLGSTVPFGWSSTTSAGEASYDVSLFRDAAQTLAQRNGVNPQVHRIYNTFTDASNYERGVLDWSTTSNVLRIGTEAAGTGTVRNISLVGGNVGIGTTSPGEKLTVDNGANFGTILQLTTSNVAGGYLRLTAGTRTVRFGADSSIGPHFGSTQYGGVCFPDAGEILPTNALAVSNGVNDIGRSGYRWRTLYVLNADLSGQSLTGSLSTSLIESSATWNTTGTPTAIKLNITDTASNAASLLMDLQVGGTSRFSVRKDGFVSVDPGVSGPIRYSFVGQTTTGLGYFNYGLIAYAANVYYWLSQGGFTAPSASWIGWSQTFDSTANQDLKLYRDAAQTLAQRNGTNPQVHRIYNTFTDASNYERAKIAWESNTLRIGTEKAGTGSARALELQTDGTTRLTIASTGAATFSGNVTSAGEFQSSGTGGFIARQSSTGAAIGITNTSSGRIDQYANFFQWVRNNPFDAVMTLDATTGQLGIGTSSPTSRLHIAETWNNAATTFTGILANVTDTASNAASLLMDLQVGGTSRVSVAKNAGLSITGVNGTSGSLFAIRRASTSNPGSLFKCVSDATYDNAGFVTFFDIWSVEMWGNSQYWSSNQSSNFRQWLVSVYDSKIKLNQNTSLEWYGADYRADTNTSDLILRRDAAGTLAQRNSTNAQSFRIYNTFTDSSNYERAKIAWESNVLRIGTEKAGTGSARALELQTDGTTRLTIDGSTGAVILPNSSSTSSFLLRGAAFATTGINITSAGALLFSGGGAGTDLSVASNVVVHRGLQIGPSDGFTELYQAGSPSGTQTGVLEQRYTTCPQTYRIYATRSSSTNYERAKLEWATDGSVFRIGTEKGSGGGSAKPVEIQTDGTTRLTISTTGLLTLADASNLAVGTTTGTKIGTATTQKLGFWNATPDVQPTTAVAAATLVGGGGTAITDTDTFDGYTIKQIVKALRNLGLLA